jgi:hypothetical protein
MPANPDTWEEEMGSSVVQGQLWQKVKLVVMAHAYNPSYMGGTGRRMMV